MLDTHIWVWSLLRPERLSPEVHNVLENPETELWLSPVSLWEFLILVQKGRIELDSDPDRWVSEALARVPLKEAPLSFAIAQESRRLNLGHDDPADHFIAATAKVLELTLITHDRRLVDSREFRVLPNRKG